MYTLRTCVCGHAIKIYLHWPTNHSLICVFDYFIHSCSLARSLIRSFSSTYAPVHTFTLSLSLSFSFWLDSQATTTSSLPMLSKNSSVKLASPDNRARKSAKDVEEQVKQTPKKFACACVQTRAYTHTEHWLVYNFCLPLESRKMIFYNLTKPQHTAHYTQRINK